MSTSEQNVPTSQSLIKELCRQMCPGIDSANLARMSKAAITTLCRFDTTNSTFLSDNDEFAVAERIKKHLQSRGQDASVFDALHKKLITVSRYKMQNRSAVLTLFLKLSEAESSSNGNLDFSNISQHSFDSLAIPRHRTVSETQSTKRSPSFRGLPTSTKQSVESMNRSNGLPKENSVSINVNTERRINRSSSERPEMLTRTLPSSQTPPRTQRFAPGKYDVTELQIIKELLFCFQGIEGDILRLDNDNGFKIDPLAKVTQPNMVRSLMEMGYLHNCVTSSCQQLEEKGGNVARGLTTAIRAQLTEYYSTVAELHSKLKQTQSMSQIDDSPLSEETSSHFVQTGLTLRRLLVWMREPRRRFQVLVDLCQVCMDLRGGAIISAAYPYSYHGSLEVQKTATKLLAAAARPLFTLMCHWIVQGELYDPYDEFFVGVNKMCLPHNQWKDKYFLRNSLVPAVMTEQQAMMVLSAGRCINFLNEICSHKMEVTGARAKLRKLHTAKEGEFLQLAEPASPLAIIIEAACREASQLVLETLKSQFYVLLSMFVLQRGSFCSWQSRPVLAIIIEAACREASQLVLETLKSQFKLFVNFHGLRRYMLMGQGDFYRYLIQLLEPELNKNVDQVYQHTLVSILDTAIRSTNCQYEDKEVLSRLCVKTFDASLGETGWDTFTMAYNTYGPLDTVFQLGDGTYQAMFLFLWQLKRVEYSLSNFRKEQTCVLKKLQIRQDFRELQTMLNTCSLMTAEMVHYINQVLYYIMFEVIECAFESFAAKFNSATTIEEVIHDHEIFLQEIKTKTLKDDSETSRELFKVMTSLNLAILNLVSYGGQFLERAEAELERRVARDRRVEAEGTNYEEEAQNQKAVSSFNIKIHYATKEINNICHTYKENVRKLLVQLSTQQTDLQLLCMRLDFNEFYKRSEPELSENLKLGRVTNFNSAMRSSMQGSLQGSMHE
ncbi:LOW QUALITY PROTEIN: gamma-tubulin complex component 3-like [Macrosteles quadrilineatus]|uniref:LOW QUALITY PROTEIN: gamma-tubulin complex component 3-like n=1 Tax=Macrosteles quadrilineatus TaxID=74068 RepID=UPI0023E34B7B|nr:LOW QUALITY PROTEIN: gamma-tubulin complex component 3-like [Macrosteles quadrilineatus]